MDNNLNDAAVWAAGGTGAVGIAFYLLRLAIKGLSSDSVVINNNKADNGIIKRLQDDSTRLESIIKKQAMRIDDLEQKLHALHDVEIEDAADLAELAVLMESMCLECGDNNRSQRITNVLTRLRSRRQRLRENYNIRLTVSGEVAPTSA
jgi:hypothetical protein